MKVRRSSGLVCLQDPSRLSRRVRKRPRNNKNPTFFSSWVTTSAGCSRASITAVDGWRNAQHRPHRP